MFQRMCLASLEIKNNSSIFGDQANQTRINFKNKKRNSTKGWIKKELKHGFSRKNMLELLFLSRYIS